MLHKFVFFMAIVALGLAAVACGGGAATGSSTRNAVNVTVVLTEFKFEPANISATAGQAINLTVKNTGSIRHTWVLPQANVKIIADPGQTVTKSFVAPKTGVYKIDCDEPGHPESGMIGQFISK